MGLDFGSGQNVYLVSSFPEMMILGFIFTIYTLERMENYSLLKMTKGNCAFITDFRKT